MAVDAILADLGTPAAREAIQRLSDLDESACDRLLAIQANDIQVPVGAGASDGRAVFEDLTELLGLAAKTWPERFIAIVDGDPRLKVDTAVIWALGAIRTPDSSRLLREALRGPNAWARWGAWSALVSRAGPGIAGPGIAGPGPAGPGPAEQGLAELLGPLLDDPDSVTRFTAVQSAIEHGDQRHLPRLEAIAADERAGIGTREFARDAVEVIARRAGLEVEHPRLVEVMLPARLGPVEVIEVQVREASRVKRDDLLLALRTEWGEHRIVAPCDGVLVSLCARVGEPPGPLLLRLRSDLVWPRNPPA